MEKKYFFRVTTRENKSAFVYDTKWSITCIKDKWVGPKIEGSKLMTFDSYGHAERYAMPESRIWKCEVRKPKEIYTMISPRIIREVGRRTILSFWTTRSQVKTQHAFAGTFAVDKIKIVKLLKKSGYE